MIGKIIIAILMLFICIFVVYRYFIKQIEELENRILILEQRIVNYKRELYKKYNDLNNTINVLIEYKKFENYSKYNKLEKKVKNKWMMK